MLLRDVPACDACIGAIAVTGVEGERAAPGHSDLLSFGRAAAPFEGSAERLLRASDAELRRMTGIGAAIATDGQRIRVVSSGAEPVALYRHGRAWSTHATAAALLDQGAVEFDPRALPELLAVGFVGGDATLVRGASAVPAGWVADIGAEVSERLYWPPAARYGPISEQSAERAADEALVGAAGEQLAEDRHTVLGLTSGVDSLVTAVAMQEAGIAFEAFTWGEPNFGENAADRAARLGVGHQVLPLGFDLEEDHGLARVGSEARWTEGLARLSARGAPGWPQPISAFVTGAGGETGRAFWYRWEARGRPDPSREEVAALLAGATPSLLPAARQWVAAAAATEHTGWRLLDVVYAQQRLRKWGRGMLPRAQADLVAPLTAPEVQPALVSLPLEARLTDAFGRRFIERRRPDLTPPAPVRQRGGVPPPLRRAAAAVRSVRRHRQPTPAVYSGFWDDRPQELAWLSEVVLRHQGVTATMGEQWAEQARAAMLAGSDAALQAALVAAGPVAFAMALVEMGATAITTGGS